MDAPKTGNPTGLGICFVIMRVAVRFPGISDRAFCLPYAARLWRLAKDRIRPKKGIYITVELRMDAACMAS